MQPNKSFQPTVAALADVSPLPTDFAAEPDARPESDFPDGISLCARGLDWPTAILYTAFDSLVP